MLFFIKVRFLQGLHVVHRDGLIVKQALDDAAFEQVFFDDLGHIRDLDLAVKAAFRVDDHNRAERAKTKAARAHDLDLLLKTAVGDLLFQRLDDRRAVGGGAAGTAANQNVGTIHRGSSLLRGGADGEIHDRVAVYKMLVDDLDRLFGGHFDIGDLFLAGLHDLYDRLVLAHADAAGL